MRFQVYLAGFLLPRYVRVGVATLGGTPSLGDVRHCGVISTSFSGCFYLLWAPRWTLGLPFWVIARGRCVSRLPPLLYLDRSPRAAQEAVFFLVIPICTSLIVSWTFGLCLVTVFLPVASVQGLVPGSWLRGVV